jgi:hypothetical protein
MSNFQVDQRTVAVSVAPGVVPRLVVKCAMQVDEFPRSTTLAVTGFNPVVELAGVPIPVVAPSSSFMYYDTGTSGKKGSGNCEFALAMYPHITRYIEAARRGDVRGMASLWFDRIMIMNPPNAPPTVVDARQAPQIALDFSRDRWAGILQELGYDGSWVTEVQPPTGPGWPEVEEHLQRAAVELRAGQAQAAARACRDAWAAANPRLEGRWESVDDLMKRHSKKLGKFPPLSARVATTYDDVSHLLNDARFLADTSAHGEAHVLGDEEALLIYRLTHSLLSYLSRRAKETETVPTVGGHV